MPTRLPSDHPARILWVDDQITAFGAHIENLEDSGYEVVPVASSVDALSAVRNERGFDAILVDLKMPDSHGIDLLKDLSANVSETASTRIVVLSSFLYDPIIRLQLVQLKLNVNVSLLEKTYPLADRPTATLSERLRDVLDQKDAAPPISDQFTTWDAMANRSDPFEISLSTYLDSPMVVRLQLDKKAQTATREIRTRLARKGVVWSLFCGSSEKPLMTASDVNEIPSDEQIFSHASKEGHPPYEFYERGEFDELTDKIEADPLSRDGSGCPGAPEYPFFSIRVVHLGDDNFEYNRVREFHFDSGLDATAFDLEAALKIGFDVDTEKPAKTAKYNGQDHSFYTFTGDAYIHRGTRGTLQVTINGRAYPEWEHSPFSRRCKEFGCAASELCFRRHALLGRNLLVENELELDLRRISTSL